MNNLKIAATFLIFAGMTTSCLKFGLDELETYDGTAIQSISGVYYRYYSDEINPGTGEVKVKQVILDQTAEVDEEAGTVDCTISIPSSFPAEQIENLTLSYDANARCGVCVVVNLSAAAIIKPLDGAPALGAPGDWSKPNRYLVTAASGNTREWTITVRIQRGDRTFDIDSAEADKYWGNAVYDDATENWKFGYVVNNEAYIYLTFKSTTGGKDTPPSGTLTRDKILAATWGGKPVTITDCKLTLIPDTDAWQTDGSYTLCNYQLQGKVVGTLHKYATLTWNFSAGKIGGEDGYGSAWMYYDMQ